MSDAPSSPPPPEPEVRPNALNAFDALGKYLEDDGWHPRRVEDKYVYRSYFQGKNSGLNVYAQVRVDLEQFIFYAVATVKVPDEVRPAVSEFLTHANYGLRIGNLEMDFSDGEVRYKSSLDFEGATLTPSLIRNAIYPAVNTLDHYLPGILRVAFGGATPSEAIEEVEK